MDRRAFLCAAAAAPVRTVLPANGRAQTFAPQPGRWRTFELVTRVEVAKPAGVTRALVPVPVPVADSDWQKPLSNNWRGNARAREQIADQKYGASLIYAEWSEAEKAPVYGVRMAKSAFGYKALRASSPDGSKAQHCRSEQGETAEGRLDSLDPDNFKYRITTREVSAA